MVYTWNHEIIMVRGSKRVVAVQKETGCTKLKLNDQTKTSKRPANMLIHTGSKYE